MNDIYLKIKSIRVKKNLTQDDVAKHLGMAQSNYARMERGLSQITVERLAELAEIFEMSPEAIMGYSEEGGDFKEDAQYYYNQVKKLEEKVKKLQKELEERDTDDLDSFSRREAEKKKLSEKVGELRKELAAKEALLQEKQQAIERLEREKEERGRTIEHLQAANTKLLELLTR
ncbi:helix-turn-helix domain-containing protein [Telluribacter humicola]|uniref:helix-turn-helix domain-containing protein n=1 Tax=Telluribacter humicola TaxID=1720261 RepID=UPI001A956B41|nr:helix-turn-helix transcriptional regulator [Telluribacter humicola]